MTDLQKSDRNKAFLRPPINKKIYYQSTFGQSKSLIISLSNITIPVILTPFISKDDDLTLTGSESQMN